MEVHPLSPLLDCVAQHYCSSWDSPNLPLITKQNENFEVLATLKSDSNFSSKSDILQNFGYNIHSTSARDILLLNSLFSPPPVLLAVGLKQSESKKWQEDNFIPQLLGKANFFLDEKVSVTVAWWSLANRNHVPMDCCTHCTNCMIAAKPYSSNKHHLRGSECDCWLYYLSFNLLPRTKTFHLCF